MQRIRPKLRFTIKHAAFLPGSSWIFSFLCCFFAWISPFLHLSVTFRCCIHPTPILLAHVNGITDHVFQPLKKRRHGAAQPTSPISSLFHKSEVKGRAWIVVRRRSKLRVIQHSVQRALREAGHLALMAQTFLFHAINLMFPHSSDWLWVARSSLSFPLSPFDADCLLPFFPNLPYWWKSQWDWWDMWGDVSQHVFAWCLLSCSQRFLLASVSVFPAANLFFSRQHRWSS